MPRRAADRLPIQIGAKIGGELLGGEIALLRLLAQRLEQNSLQIGVEPLAGARRGAGLRGGSSQITRSISAVVSSFSS